MTYLRKTTFYLILPLVFCLLSGQASSKETVVDDGLWVVKEIDPGARIDKKGLVIPKIYEKRHLGLGTQWRFGSGHLNWLFADPIVKGNHSEFDLGLRYGLSWGSLEVRLGYGELKNYDRGAVDSQSVEINGVHSLRMGAVYYAESLSFSDYFAPYIEVGTYRLIYSADISGTKNQTFNTKDIPYGVIGFNLPLGWLDKKNAILAHGSLSLSDFLIYGEYRAFFPPENNTTESSNQADFLAGLSFIF